jgi:transcriptional regulator NrdR family protein
MDDLVKRLLAGTGGGKHWMDLHEEAADEITRLRAKLEECLECNEEFSALEKVHTKQIAALEARITKADALATHADILLKQGLNTGVAKEIVVGNLVSTLAAYREGSDT